MKKNIFLILCFCFAIIINGQNATLSWAKKTGSAPHDEGHSIAVDALGNVYTTGFFQGTVDFDPSPATYTLSSAGGLDVFISKIDVLGNFVWAKQMGGPTFDFAYGIVVDASGNVYTTGYFNGTSDFDPGPATFTLSAFAGSNDIFVSKLDATGSFVWAKQLGGTLGDVGQSIALDGLGNVYTTGFFQGTVDFDPGVGTYTLTSFSSNNNVFISKLDGAGNFVWAKQIGGASNDGAYSIAVDASGNVYTTGAFSGTTDFDPGIGTYTLTSTSSAFDIFVSKLDVSGNFAWAKQLGGTSTDQGEGISYDASGNVFTTGYFQGVADFDPGPGSFTLASAGGTDVFISKLDIAGNFVWAKQLAGPFGDVGWGISSDPLGNVYTTGHFVSTIDFDPGPGTFTMSSVGSSIDVFILKLDGLGNFAWAKRLGGALNEVGLSIAVNTSTLGNVNVYSTGYFEGLGDFDPNVGFFGLTSAGNGDIFIHKMGQCVVVTTTLTSQTNVLCNSAATGAATIIANGGPGYTYTWSPSGGNSASANGLFSNTYSCTVTNSCGSTATETVLITQPPALTLTAVANNTIVCAGDPSTLTASGSGGVGGISYVWIAGPSNSIAIVNPTTTSIYTITITDANNCSKSQTLSVATNSLPIITVNSGSICAGNSFIITPSGASSYTIQGGSVIVSPTTNTSYTVVGTTVMGCVSALSATSNVTVNPNPIVTAVSNSSLLCVGQNATLIASGANTYTFNPGGAGSSVVISPTITTTYTLNGTDVNGCNNSSTITQSVSACTGLDQITNTISELIIYPNPFNNKITVITNGSKQLLQIFNSLGSSVFNTIIETENLPAGTSAKAAVEINLRQLPSGIYFVRTGTVTKKLIKE